MKRVHFYQRIVSLISLSLLLSACGTMRVEPTLTATSTDAPAVAPTASETPIPPATASPSPVPTLSGDEFMARQNPVEWLAWSADGKMLVVDSLSGLYTVGTQGDLIAHPLEKGDGFHSAMAFNPQNNLLLADNHVWDVITGKIRYEIPLKKVYRANFSPDGKTLVIGEDNRISFWDAATGKFQKSIGDGLGNAFWGLSFNADGSALYAVYDEKVKLADLASGKFSESLNLPKGGCCVVFSPNAQTIMINLPNHGGGHKEIWDVQSAKMLINAENCDSDVSLTAFSPDSKSIVTGPCAGDAALWDIQTQKLLHRFPGRVDPEWRGAAFSLDGSKLALSNDIGEVQIWDLTSYQLLQTLNIPKVNP